MWNQSVNILTATVVSLCLASASNAQTDTENEDVEDSFIITGTPLERNQSETASAVTVMERDEILEAGAATLGDLLANQPGIHQSSFAGGASRPIIRGLDNFRVRVQENGVGVHDASALSEDHGVPIDPLSAQRVEVVRGPAVLRYGSEAIGGVVNVLNNRIPNSAPDGGYRAEAFSMLSSVDDGIQAGGLVDFGDTNFAGHVDAFFRQASDYDIPRNPGTQIGTDIDQSGGAIGGSILLPNGHLGASVTFFQSAYGIPATEEPTFIEMEQSRFQVAGTLDDLSPVFTTVQFSGGFSDYTHDEIAEGTGEVGSTFDNEELEGRVELIHRPFGVFTGAIGVQARQRELTASGEGGELLAPSETRAAGAFIFEEVDLSEAATLQLAVRVERVEIDGTGFLPMLPDGLEFAARRDFTPLSGSAGLIFDLSNDLYLSGTVQIIQRAPDVLELFAKGPHEATGTFELGNPNLDVETARSLELTLKRLDGPFRFELTGFYTSFEDFIFKAFTGIECGEEFSTCGVEDELNQIAYAQEDATFTGFEASAEFDVMTLRHGGVITIDTMADYVRAELDTGGNVPRIPPFRLGAGVTYETPRLTGHLGLMHVGEQDQLAAFETLTGAYTTVDARLVFRFDMPNTDTPFEVGLAGANLLDEAARNHSSFKKDGVLLPGRNIRVFVRARF